MTRTRYFVILGAMRTGSNLLEQIIAGIPGTFCFGEAYNSGFIGGPQRQDLPDWTLERRNNDPLAMLDAMIAQAGDKLPGFRLFDGHSDAVLTHVLTDPTCARIVLKRDPVESFISLQIAQETGQWILRNPKRRRMARVRFDPDAFEAYRARLDRHYQDIAKRLRDSGQTALDLDYLDLDDPDLPDRLAGFLGLSPGLAASPALLRQNPRALRTKVTNYEEICAYLGLTPTPLRPQPLPGPARFLLSNHLPIAAAPVPGPGLLPLQALIHRLDCRAAGADGLGRSQLINRAERGALLETGPAKGRRAFCVVAAPDRRLKWLMGRVLFSGPDGPARLILQERHPDLPEQAATWRGWPAGRRHGVFADFLDLVEAALSDRADLPCPAAWHSQANLVDALRSDGAVIELFAEGDFPTLCQAVIEAGGVSTLPRGQTNAIASLVEPMPDDDPIPAALSERANRLHARDLQDLAPWLGTRQGVT